MNLTFHQFKYLLDSLVMSLLWYILEYIIDFNEVKLKAKQILIYGLYLYEVLLKVRFFVNTYVMHLRCFLELWRKGLRSDC